MSDALKFTLNITFKSGIMNCHTTIVGYNYVVAYQLRIITVLKEVILFHYNTCDISISISTIFWPRFASKNIIYGSSISIVHDC